MKNLRRLWLIARHRTGRDLVESNRLALQISAITGEDVDTIMNVYACVSARATVQFLRELHEIVLWSAKNDNENEEREIFEKAQRNFDQVASSIGLNEVDCSGCTFEETQTDCKWCDKYNCHPLFYEDNTTKTDDGAESE